MSTGTTGKRCTQCHPELDAFATLVLSFECGLCKPDAAIFELAVAHAGVPAEACFFTDDRQKFVDPAVALGIDGHLFQGVDDLRGALTRRGAL